MADTAVMSSTPARSVSPGKRVNISPDEGPGPRGVGGEARRPDTHTPGGGPAASDRLTPMPEYLKPVVRSAVTRWKKLHDDHMMEKLVNKRTDKKEKNLAVRQDAMNLARKIPMDLLARHWLSAQRTTAETRAFMVDQLLPTLILGVERLLVEVDKRGLTGATEPDPNFNPINYLARYLMRNNPRYSNFCEASPYVRGLRQVGEELKNQLFDIEENKLARIKAEARKAREERERSEAAVRAETQRRESSLQRQHTEWDVGLYPDGRVEQALVQNGLLSFRELSQSLPDKQRESCEFSAELEPTDDTGKTLLLNEFIAYLQQYVEEMPAQIFDLFVIHMSQCAHSYRISAEREQRRVLLSQVFLSCDHTGVGLLDRHRVLNLFEMFYDRSRDDVKESLRNPREWPVVDVLEIDHSNHGNEENPGVPDNSVAVSMETEQSSVHNDEENAQTELQDNADVSNKNPADDVMAEKKSDEPNDAEKENVTTEDVEKDDTTPESETKDNVEDAKEGDEDSEKEKEKSAENEKDKDEAETSAEVKTRDREPELGGVTDGEEPPRTGDRIPPRTGDHPPETQQEEPPRTGDRPPETEQEEPPRTGDRPPETQQSRVSFAEGTTFERERTALSTHGRSPSASSAFDEGTVNMSQFIQMTETFIGDEPNSEGFDLLVRWVREGYRETEEERTSRIIKSRRELLSARRKALVNSLFEMWDNDGSGFIDYDEVETVMNKYKGGIEVDAVSRAKRDMRLKNMRHDMRLSKREFRHLVLEVIANLAGGADQFENYIDFLFNSVERSYAERVRGEARKKWLQQIIQAGETSGVNMELIYKAVFQALYKDAETHGDNKVISANIAMLERNDVMPERGDVMLRYVATTPEDADLVLGKTLFSDTRCISFSSVETGKPIHVPRVSAHGGVHFWNTDRTQQPPEGAFIVIPLKDRRKRVFGLIGIDTLSDPHSRSIFITHEIQFYQGVAKAFSIAYHQVELRQKTMEITEGALSSMHQSTPNVREIGLYMVEPDTKGSDYVLRKMMTSGEKGDVTKYNNPARLERKDNLFRDYLFKCVDNSDSVAADAYGDRHMTIPIRNNQGLCVIVVDISIGELKALSRADNREVMKILKQLQIAFREILTAADEEEDVNE